MKSQFLRRKVFLSQRELAELSGVPVRTIQYEQRQKNINKAQYLVMLARVLCCAVEELLETTAYPALTFWSRYHIMISKIFEMRGKFMRHPI